VTSSTTQAQKLAQSQGNQSNRVHLNIHEERMQRFLANIDKQKTRLQRDIVCTSIERQHIMDNKHRLNSIRVSEVSKGDDISHLAHQISQFEKKAYGNTGL